MAQTRHARARTAGTGRPPPRGSPSPSSGRRSARPAPYLSLLENGKVEPKIGLIGDLADALDVVRRPARSGATQPPGRARDRARAAPSRAALLRRCGSRRSGRRQRCPTRSSNTSSRWRRRCRARERPTRRWPGRRSGAHRQRRACARDARPRQLLRRDREGRREAARSGRLPGSGPVSEGVLTDLAAHFGFTVERCRACRARPVGHRPAPPGHLHPAAQRPAARRAARSVVLQTLGHFALGHRTENFADYLRQRIESNYFAAAVLLPEAAAVRLLARRRTRATSAIEDLKEVFYISYEMAAHRFTNLATEHLGLPGALPAHRRGGGDLEGVRERRRALPRRRRRVPSRASGCAGEWGTRQVFEPTTGSPCTTSTPTPPAARSGA